MIFLDKFLQGLKPQFDDDVIDRLNYYYTPMMLIIFALTLSAKQYVGQPIQCWPPAQFTGAWEQYSENYCFVKNTYFLPLNHYIPQDLEVREQLEIGYYQWVPFVLGIQGILFYLPSLLWRILNWQSGVAVKGIIQMCEDVGNMAIEKRKNSVDVVATHLRDSLRTQRNLSRRYILSPLLARGSYLTTLYLIVKVLYLMQVLMQFVVLNAFLGTNYTFWGFEILRDLAYGREWQESGHFPRVTMCDFDIRVLGNKHRHTLQCVLMINMFNEKIYLFIWWWFLVVAIATLANLFYWLSMSMSDAQQTSFVTQYLRVYHLLKSDDLNEREAVNKFVHHHLRSDGVFLLRLISMNAGDLITTDIVYSLWHQFLQDEAAMLQTLPLGESATAPDPTAGLEDVDGYGEKQRLT
ncbi:innexin domain-containing protein [Ditylenchus destructor]|nr:innexin domain-containing protein [Ditylenchus destructor]